jgi:hypothetical protein
MLEELTGLPEGIVGLRATGTVTAHDYEQVVEPLFEQLWREDHRARVLLCLGPGYEGFTPGAVVEKTGIVLRRHAALRRVEGYAIVSDIGWVGEVVHLAGFLLPFPVRVFADGSFADAVSWLQSLPEGPGVSHHLDPATGVLVIDVDRPVRAQDIDAVATTTDDWLATHAELPGIVVHARSFPGWENLAGMLHHLRFVRDHHRRVRRVGVAADGRSATVLSGLAEHFTAASVRCFGFDEMPAALRWAAASAPPGDAAAPRGSGTPAPGG